MTVAVICRHDPATHTRACPAITIGSGVVCGRRVKHHADIGRAGCGNYCGIHARALFRGSWQTVILDVPHVDGRRVSP